MKRNRLLAVILCLMLGSSLSAQFNFYPKLYGSMQTLDFGTNDLGLEKVGNITVGIEVTGHYNLAEVFSVLAGIGVEHIFETDTTVRGDITYLPAYVGLRVGKKFYVEGVIGFDIPITSSGIGYLTGWFTRGSIAYDFGEFTIGASIDMHNLFKSKELSYVPKKYVPAKDAIGFGLFIEAKI